MTPVGELPQVQQEVVVQEGLLRNQTLEVGMGGLPQGDQLTKQLEYGGLREGARPVSYLEMGDEEFGIVDLSNVKPDEDGLRRPFPPGVLHNQEDFGVPDAGDGLPTLMIMHFERPTATARAIVPGKPMILGSRPDIAAYDERIGNPPFTYTRDTDGRTTISRYHGSLIQNSQTGRLEYTDHESTNGTYLRFSEQPTVSTEATVDVHQPETAERQETVHGDSAKISAYALAMQNKVRGLELKESLTADEASFLSTLASSVSRDVKNILVTSGAPLPEGAFESGSRDSLWNAIGAAREILTANEGGKERGSWLMEKFDKRFSDPDRLPTGADIEWLMGYMAEAASVLYSQPKLRDAMEIYAADTSKLLANLAHQNRHLPITQYMHGNMQWVLGQYKKAWGEPTFRL